MQPNYLYLIPLLPLAGAIFNLLFGRNMSKATVHTVAIGVVAAAFGVVVWHVAGPLWSAFHTPAIEQGISQRFGTWIEVGGLSIDFTFRLDTLSAVMTLVITFVGTLIHIYSTGYMSDEPRYASYFGYLNLFTSAMLILVLGDSLPIMFIGWEGVGVCSYLLIGFWYTNESYAYAGRKAFVVNRIGDFAFLLGMFLLWWGTNHLDFPGLRTAEAGEVYRSAFGGERFATWGAILLFIGACGKSAQIPLYVWLPDAMAGPTPVSALIHAATMVTAGVYMIARMSFLYAHSTTAMAVVAVIGTLTALVAAFMAFAQTDLKKVLAYSTVSQLGFMFAAVGVGAFTAGVFHLVTHAFFKAGLFLGAGSVMHAMSGSGDITKMGGLRKHLPITHLVFLIYCLAIAGFPGLAGFFSKDEILAGAFGIAAQGWPMWFGKAIWMCLLIAALGTAFYMFRLYFLVFWGECRADEETQHHIHESPASMTIPLLVLAAFSVVIGYIGLPHIGHLPNLIGKWLEPSLVDFANPSIRGALTGGHASATTTILLMGVATAMGLLGIVLAWTLYRRGPSASVEAFTARGFGASLYQWSRDKLYVDEFYEKIVVKPMRFLADSVLFDVFDRGIIDTVFVNGLGKLTKLSGSILRKLQSGDVQRYMAALVIGGALVFWFTNRAKPDFTYEQAGNLAVVFSPHLDGGPDEAGATVEFDFDEDGKSDYPLAGQSAAWQKDQPMFVHHAFAEGGKYPVTMVIRHPDFGERKITKTVEVRNVDTAVKAGASSL